MTVPIGPMTLAHRSRATKNTLLKIILLNNSADAGKNTFRLHQHPCMQYNIYIYIINFCLLK